jgi:SAM-dependent methyltransferase
MRPDYSSYLTPAQLDVEEKLWAEGELYKKYSTIVNRLGLKAGANIIEVGCGTGWVPTQLSTGIQYTGLDKNPGCLAKASEKNPERIFLNTDIRDFAPWQLWDAVITFAVLKHFGLHEWDAIVERVLSLGKAAAFTLPVYENDALPMDAFDNGVDYPHVWIRRDRLEAVLEKAGHRIVESGPLEGEWEQWFVTRRG